MPYQKIKTASFTNFGGINSKTSPYIVSQNEFTNLVNVDFQMPGSLTKRWGSTMYVGTTLSTKITGLYEFSQTTGASQVIAVGQSTVYKATGFSLSPIYNSFGFTTFISGITTADFGGISGFIGLTYVATGYTYFLGGTYWYDFENYANFLWACNGTNIWKYNGSTFYFFSLPLPRGDITVMGPFAGSSSVVTGMTGYYYYANGYRNIRGYVGAVDLVGGRQIIAQGATNIVLSMRVNPGVTYGPAAGYGVTALEMYRAGPYATLTPPNQLTYINIGNLPIGGNTFVDNNIIPGATNSILPTGLAPSSLPMNPEIWSQAPISYSSGVSGDFSLPLDVFYQQPIDFHPKFIELYNNQMFFSGFNITVPANASGQQLVGNPLPDPSIVWFSDIGEPESIQAENNFNVRTNDGDQIRGMKTYISSLLIFKTNSFHRLYGQDPANFSLVEVSTQYGCISNRAVCVAKNTCYFLDRKGVIAFNGANIDIISNKIDPIFARMNYSAALDQASMTYDKFRNQILIEIPIDSSTTNNFTVVYDIIVNAWTTYEGIRASSSAIAKGSLSNFSYLYGNYNGGVLNVGASYLSDNGTGYTALIQTRFFNEIDPATTKQWRRVFFNVDQASGSTLRVDLIANYGSSISVTRYFQQTPYLSRIDFGIPSTALSFTLSNFSSVDTLRLHGFTVEYRFQRNVQDIE